MNPHIIEDGWKQLRDRIKNTWLKLTDDDLDRAHGRIDQVACLLQERYGYDRDKAARSIEHLIGDELPARNVPHRTQRGVAFLLVTLLAVGISLSSGCSSTDPGLTASIKTKLAADSTVKAYKIDVDTTDKVVTLTGSVDSQVEKDQALALARETKGVVEVVDMISVRTAAGSGNAPEPPRTIGDRIDDAGITMAVKSRLLDDPQVKGLRIDVDTREGVVYLTGSVNSAAEKERAVSLAQSTEHVREVVSNLTVERS